MIYFFQIRFKLLMLVSQLNILDTLASIGTINKKIYNNIFKLNL